MELKTERAKSASAIAGELEDTQARLKELRFKLSSNQLKAVREIRKARRTIARLKTLLAEFTH